MRCISFMKILWLTIANMTQMKEDMAFMSDQLCNESPDDFDEYFSEISRELNLPDPSEWTWNEAHDHYHQLLAIARQLIQTFRRGGSFFFFYEKHELFQESVKCLKDDYNIQ